MAGQRLLVADDDAVLRQLVTQWLREEGYAVRTCSSRSALENFIQKSRPDLLLLDVMLGDADGIDVCRRLKENPATQSIPVILISGALTGNEHQAKGLKGGADDFLIKPLDPVVLKAKVEAVIRRATISPQLQESLIRHGITLELASRRVHLGNGPIALTRKEFDLLAYLLTHPNKVLSPKTLLASVWGYQTDLVDNHHTVEEHMYRLKKKLGTRFASRLTTVVGSGYRLE